METIDLTTIDATQIGAAAELIYMAGLTLVQGQELNPASTILVVQIRQCLHLVLTCLAYDSIDVWGAVVDLVLRVLVSIERRGGDWNVFLGGGSRCDDAMRMMCKEVALRLLPILRQRMKYPDDHKFDHEECRWTPRGGVPHGPLQGLPAHHEPPPSNCPVVCGCVLWRSPCIVIVVVALAHVICWW
jgi:hypothetical protein